MKDLQTQQQHMKKTLFLAILGASAISASAVTIDGTIGAGEWTGPGVVTVTIGTGWSYPSSSSGTAYLRADQNYLYAALDMTGYTAGMDHGNVIGISASQGSPPFNMPATATAWVEFSESTNSAWWAGGPTGSIDGQFGQWNITGVKQTSFLDLLAATDWTSGHRITEFQIPLSGLGGLTVGETIWVSGVENWAGTGHIIPDTMPLTWNSNNYVAMQVEAGAATPDGGTTLVLLGGALTGLGALRRKFRA